MAKSKTALGPASDCDEDGKEFGGFFMKRSKTFTRKNTRVAKQFEPVACLFQFL